MRQWDIYLFHFSAELPHPAVIISNDERCQNADLDVVNALICTTAQLNRAPKKWSIIQPQPIPRVIEQNTTSNTNRPVRPD